jgi:hypothetical protein
MIWLTLIRYKDLLRAKSSPYRSRVTLPFNKMGSGRKGL